MAVVTMTDDGENRAPQRGMRVHPARAEVDRLRAGASLLRRFKDLRSDEARTASLGPSGTLFE